MGAAGSRCIIIRGVVPAATHLSMRQRHEAMNDLSRQVIITGGSSGLGLESAIIFAEKGWNICLIARDQAKLEEARQTVASFAPEARVEIRSADVRDYAALEQAVSGYASEFGGFEAVIHSAGRMQALGPIGTTDPAQWQADIETTLIGAGNLARACSKWFGSRSGEAGSAFVAFVGPGHHEGLGFGSGYAAAQAGLVRLIENLDLERKWPRTAGESPAGRVAYYALYSAVTPTGVMNHVLSHADGRKWLPRFTEMFAEGKEVEPHVPAATAVWLCDRKPQELSGRVVSGMLDPELVEMRLAILGEGDKGRLRLRF